MTEDEFNQLVTRYLEGVMDERELQHLNQVLSASEERVRAFNDRRLLGGLIQEHGEAKSPEEGSDVVPIGETRATPPSGRGRLVVFRDWRAAAAFVVSGLLVGCLGTGALWAFSSSASPDFWEVSGGLFDGGFEQATGPDPYGYPTEPLIWTGDPVSSIEGPVQGISSYEGKRMLRFDATAREAPGPKNIRANRWQIVSLDALRPTRETALATARARFNRVEGDHRTDRQVRVEIAAFAGLPNTAEAQLGADEFLSRAISRVEIDGDPSTWEEVKARIVVPAEADFLLIGISAVEDVSNELPSEREFHGHYADAVELRLTGGTSLEEQD